MTGGYIVLLCPQGPAWSGPASLSNLPSNHTWSQSSGLCHACPSQFLDLSYQLLPLPTEPSPTSTLSTSLPLPHPLCLTSSRKSSKLPRPGQIPLLFHLTDHSSYTVIGTITYLMSVSPTAHSSEAGTHLFCLPFCSQLLIHGLIHSRFRKKDCWMQDMKIRFLELLKLHTLELCEIQNLWYEFHRTKVNLGKKWLNSALTEVPTLPGLLCWRF